MGTAFLKKLYVLLAVLLCSVLTLAVPVASVAAPSGLATQVHTGDADHDPSFQLAAGEVSSGDVEAILQLDKTLLSQLLQQVLEHRYPEQAKAPAIPAFYSFSRRYCGLHTILTKGP